MAAFCWQPEYSLGDEVIDGQHRVLLEIMDELAGHLRAAQRPADGEGRAIFDRLARYVTDHFAYEEQRIADADYPEERLLAHRGEHDRIITQLQAYEAVFERGDADALEELLAFLYGDWLIHHICDTDRDYVAYLAD